MRIERKDLLILLAVFLFTIVSIPGVIFNQSVKKYLAFLNIWSQTPYPIKPTNASIAPPKRRYHSADFKEPELKMITFKAKMKDVKEIYLCGDFNKWKKDDIKLVKKQNNQWEMLIPLVPGKYRYVFYVDGEKMLDPLNPSTDMLDEEKVSVLEVK